MNDEQVENIIRFETELAKIHSRRAKQMTQFLNARRQKRAQVKSKKTTLDILGKLSEPSKQ